MVSLGNEAPLKIKSRRCCSDQCPRHTSPSNLIMSIEIMFTLVYAVGWFKEKKNVPSKNAANI